MMMVTTAELPCPSLAHIQRAPGSKMSLKGKQNKQTKKQELDQTQTL